MNTVETTAVLTVIATVIAGVFVPLWLYRRKQRADRDMADVVGWKGYTDSLQADRRELRELLRDNEDRHRKELMDVKADFGEQLAAARQRITELENELAALRRAVRDGGQV